MTAHLKVVLGILGNITAICLFTSPLPTLWNITKKKSVQDFSGIPYVCTLLNCSLWVIYGSPLVEYQLLVVTINAAGAILELSYLFLYVTFAPKKLQMKVLKVLLAVVLVFTSLLLLMVELVHDKSQRKIITGTCAVVLAVGMYASPLTVMCMVIRTRSVEFMPFFLSLFTFLNGAAWFGYAFIGKVDIFITVPNGYGALSGIAQLVLYAIYKNATPLSLVLKQQEAALGSKVIGVDDHSIEDDPSLNLKPPKQIFTTPAEQHEVNIISFDDSSVNLKPPAKQITSSSPEQQVKSLTDDCTQTNSPLVQVVVAVDVDTNPHQESISTSKTV